jgi:hypothetical protein
MSAIAAPSEKERAAIKAAALATFNSDRVAVIELGAPFGVCVYIAAFDLASATAYDDGRTESAENGRSAMLAERVLWPTQERLEELRSKPECAALDHLLEQKLRRLHGFDADGEPTCARLSAMSIPPGFCAPKEAGRAAAELQAAHPGAVLWSVYHRGSGLSCIMRGPISDVWAEITSAITGAMKARQGVLSSAALYACDLCVWAPGLAPGGDAKAALRAHLNEAPGRAIHLTSPILAMGGAYAEARASFL